MKTLLSIPVILVLAGCAVDATAPQDGLPPAPPPMVFDAPACIQTQWGCSFCVGDGVDQCGNIARMRDDGSVEKGCCVGATPYCSQGVCVQTK